VAAAATPVTAARAVLAALVAQLPGAAAMLVTAVPAALAALEDQSLGLAAATPAMVVQVVLAARAVL
jgi:hypothetical protein